VAGACCYTAAAVYIVLLHVQPTPCMYLQSFLLSSPRFYSPCLHVQLTCKNYKMYSLVLSDIFALGGNDRDHSHVFWKYHTMVLLKIKGLAYPLQYTAQIMDIHSCDALRFNIVCTKHLPFFPYLYSDSNKRLSSSGLVSTLPQLNLFAYIDFPLTIKLLVGPQPDIGTFFVSKDTSNVSTKS